MPNDHAKPNRERRLQLVPEIIADGEDADDHGQAPTEPDEPLAALLPPAGPTVTPEERREFASLVLTATDDQLEEAAEHYSCLLYNPVAKAYMSAVFRPSDEEI